MRRELSETRVHIPKGLAQWLAQNYPEYTYVHWGRSGAALLFDALRQEGRKQVVLPAFICTTLPAMVVAAGMKVVFVDVNPETLHMKDNQLEQCLADSSDAETALLVDHTFGYPFAQLPDVRRRHPGLLVIEDCARALGARMQGYPVGHTGDWVLLSMYKTTPGNDHGAILLTKSPYNVRRGPAPATTWRNWASTSQTFRFLYELAKRRHPDFWPTRRAVESIPWSPDFGNPSRLCLQRFQQHVLMLEREQECWRKAAATLRAALSDLSGIRFIQPAPSCEPASYFLSFTVAQNLRRNELLTSLHKRGLFLLRTWDSVPAFVNTFRQGFRFGSTGSVILADQVAHVPVIRFLRPRRLATLVRRLRETITLWKAE